MSSCLVIEPVYPLLVRVNCEPRTRSLSFARALSLLANTLDPFLDTFPCVNNAALRANAHYSRTGSRFRCALRNWFRSSGSMKEWSNQPAEKSRRARESRGRSKGFSVSETGWRRRRSEDKEEDFLVCVEKWTTRRGFSLAMRRSVGLLLEEFSFAVNKYFRTSLETIEEG